MPEAAGGRSYGGAATGSNNFECSGYGGLEYVEGSCSGLRTSAMVVKGEGKDGG